jgi:arabinogalactan endo-1,4-beta-galactosidase
MKVVTAFLLFVWAAVALISCKKQNSNSTTPASTDSIASAPVTFISGADVSWISEMEADGWKFFNKNGSPGDIFQILKSEGINSIRLRVWVNPIDIYNSTPDVVAKAILARNAGMKIMIDFHYSDTWADPGHQTKPAAWSTENFTDLENSMYTYTVGVMDTLKVNGIIPDWVQIGNETNDGMLWPDGEATSNMANFAALVNQGYDAVKSVDDSTKVIIHISDGYDDSLFRWVFDGLKNNGAHWDVIGMSLYPSPTDWVDMNSQCLATMTDMVARYNTPVMICEAGMPWDDSTECNDFLTDLISKTKSVEGGMGLGIFYWEPESYNNWQGYTLGAFDNSGRPTIALDAFKK